MKIGITGTRGIPNRYGGFEQMTQYLSTGLVERGHEVFVYNPHNHPYHENKWNGVNIIHCYDPEYKIGTAGQFIYDLNCINDARKRDFDVLLHLGYSSDSVWHWRWPKNTINMMNMDGLEWKRSKYNKLTRQFLKRAEYLAVKNSQVLIADSLKIQQHIMARYGKIATYIPYGADVFIESDPAVLKNYNLLPYHYYLVISRLEPENNIEMIIKGHLSTKQNDPLLIIGGITNKYAEHLLKNYQSSNVIFAGAVYDQNTVNNLRYYSTYYFHGHSVGGTNPSLLEAMACRCNIAAHRNVFNQSVLHNDAEYFSTAEDIRNIITSSESQVLANQRKEMNVQKIKTIYNWENIVNSYELLMLKAVSPEIKNVISINTPASKAVSG